VIAAEIDLNHVTRAVRDMNHVTRAVIDRGHVTEITWFFGPSRPDEGSWTPSTYREFLGTFSRKKAEMLLPHRSTEHAIDLGPGTKLPFTAYFGPNRRR
jgi:hypothetical protein